jgi:hypothetical protein
VLEGYLLDPTTRAYTPMVPTPNGDLPCLVLGLSLGLRPGRYQGIERDWLRWLDADGHVLPTDEEQARDAREQAEEQRNQRVEAERRLAKALAEIERLKASSRGD